MIENKDDLNIDVHTLENGTTVVDCGVKAAGGFAAGLMFAKASMGGQGSCDLEPLSLGELFMPGVKVYLDLPAVGCMGCQYAGWAVQTDKYFAMGSGPARIKYGAEELMRELGYKDDAPYAVLAMESSKLPDKEAADYIAKECEIAGKDLYLLAARTASIAGSLQIAARVVETGLHKLVELGFDIKSILSGLGTCPVAPVAENDLKAIGLTNDCVLYGGRVWYMADCEDSEIEKILEQIPSNSSKDYGRHFYDLYQEHGDFYSIDPMLFSPAEVFINNIRSGRLYHAGAVNKDLLAAVFGKSK